MGFGTRDFLECAEEVDGGLELAEGEVGDWSGGEGSEWVAEFVDGGVRCLGQGGWIVGVGGGAGRSIRLARGVRGR